MRKIKGFCGLFFRSINKTRNSTEMQKVYSECFVFCGVFRKNIREIPVKCEIQKVYAGQAGYTLILLIFVARCPPPLKTTMHSHKWVLRSFLQKYCFFRKTCSIIKHPLPNS